MLSPSTTGLHCLFLMISACCQTQGSNFYPLSYVIDSTLGHESFYPEMQRQKRNMFIIDLPLPEYMVDIEVSLQDSSYLQPIKDYFKNINLPINISNAQTTVSNISITTVCLPSGENSSCCFCENGHAWPSTVCSDVMPCPPASLEPALPCGYKQKMPFYGPYCEPQTEESCGVGEPIVMNMSVRLDSDFQDDLKDPSSVLFQKYKADLEKAFNASYRCLPGFVSATVTGFRPGSVFVNYRVTTGAASFTQLGDSNRAVQHFLDPSYQLNQFTFTRVITNETNFTVKPSNIFEGDAVRLTCEINSTFTNVTWYHFDQAISTGSQYSIETVLATRRSILKITNVTLKDSGSYSCVFIKSSPYHTEIHNATETVSVFPLQVTPNFEDIDVTCNSPEAQAKGLLLSCCIDRHVTSLKVSWKVNGTINITGESKLNGNCTEYQLNINESLCPPEKSGSVTTYTCELETGHGARRARSIGVTYLRKAHITVSSTNTTVSEGHGFNVTCKSDVSNYDSISWKIQSGNDTKRVDCNKCIKNYSFPAMSVLTVKSASQVWRGTFICTFSQQNLDSSANVTIEVVSLPLKKNILIDPIATLIRCQVPHALQCCIPANTVRNYTVTFWVQQNEYQVVKKKKGDLLCYMYNHTHKECNKDEEFVAYCKFINRIGEGVDSEHIRLQLIPEKKISCSDSLGIGREGDKLIKPCSDVKKPKGFTRGNVTYQCTNREWIAVKNCCLTGPINDLLGGAESLVNSPEAKTELPSYLAQLQEQTRKELTTINNSSANIGAVVTILDMVSSIPAEAEELTMQNFLSTVDLIVDDSTTGAWDALNKEETQQSSLLLQSVENFSQNLQPVNNTIPSVSANTVHLQGTVVKENNNIDYNKDFRSTKNLTVSVLISGTEIQTLTQNSTIISVMYSKLGHILPQDTSEKVNGLLITTTLSSIRRQNFEVNMTFAKQNLSLKMPRCVFWNFTLKNHRGNWDDSGCTTTESGDNVSCSCNHLTSFSILMSPDGSSSEPTVEDYISYIGLAISIVSLVVCIIIESLVWKYVTNNTTSYMRHICILNIATSLLIADVWFIVTASITDQKQQMSRDICIMATFFIHFFYLCVLFWMLTLGLILFYRLVFILHNTSKTAQKAVAFCLGYVCPFVIAVTTIAVTLPKQSYTRNDRCWLNWDDSKALLAFIIPALLIVATNLFIAAVVIIKILRPTIGDRSSGQERKYLFQIGKSVAILTPLLGLTWGFGLATAIQHSHRAFHILFSALNAFQGLFILVSGTLWDKKIQEALLKRNSSSKWSSQQSKSSSLILVTPMLAMSYPFSRTFNNLCGKTGKYRVSSSEPSTSSTENTSKAYSLLN
ncbi:PREDICTED: adhesion G protein-coupled receptor F5 [Ficedula albicollis]|uniref:Adhesion G protein-coupled receptor F5 n=1 Tax=Ficedula albicollis TaxID=59894 RepID=U3JFS7_FICAL|nr:PREDICTED: adhesion G protein-coupled receptor F5 [Ficedula albicollis]